MGIPFWRDIAIVILAIEVFILALVALAALYIVNRLMWQMRSSLRPIFPQALGWARQAEWTTAGASEVATSRVISAYALAARLRATASYLYGTLRRDFRR